MPAKKKYLKRKQKKKKTNPKGLDAVTVVGLLFVSVVFLYLVFNQPGAPDEEGGKTMSTLIPQVKKKVRKPAVAGQFYPKGERQLADMVDGFLAEAVDHRLYGVRGLIAPHAGYVYSGPTAGAGFRQLKDSTIKTVIILAPSHQHAFNGASIPEVTHYKTPLGEVPVSPQAGRLRENSLFSSVPEAHEKEHSLEVMLPFLQRALGEFELVPIVTGSVDSKAVAEALKPLLDDNTLVVASTDLSHYHPYGEAVGLDEKTIEAMASLDFNTFKGREACGKTPVLVLMYLADDLGWRPHVLDYKNSGDTAGDRNRVVGYASIAFYAGVNESEQEYLTSLARRTLESVLLHRTGPEVRTDISPKLREVSGCFVTLNKHGSLRGCIGHILPQEPLYQCVTDNAVSAALNDPRFPAVSEDELSDIHIEVSVLSPPKKLPHAGGGDLIAKLVPHVDGVVLRQGRRQSTYLPQVWEQLPDAGVFLSSLCRKGGMPADCYRDEKTEVETYRAQVFEEKS